MNSELIIPPYLKNGDEIRIISTARAIDKNELEWTRDYLEKSGFKVTYGENLFRKNHQFSGTDEERLADLNLAIQSPTCKAILCARGGYGTARLIDRMNMKSLRENPKWICGYSDITALLNHVYTNLDMAGLHSSMPINFKSNTSSSLESINALLRGEDLEYTAPIHELNKSGIAEGRMIGGNLSVIYSLMGTPSQLKTEGAILFLEDLDEYLYHIDRMMLALDRAGMLKNLKGLIVGGMTDMNDNTIPFGKIAYEIISDFVSPYSYPVCFSFPSGHLDENLAWIHGKKVRLTIRDGQPSTLNYC